MSAEAATRERQLKKVQDKIEDEHKRFDDVTADIERVASEHNKTRAEKEEMERNLAVAQAELDSYEGKLQ